MSFWQNEIQVWGIPTVLLLYFSLCYLLFFHLVQVKIILRFFKDFMLFDFKLNEQSTVSFILIKLLMHIFSYVQRAFFVRLGRAKNETNERKKVDKEINNKVLLTTFVAFVACTTSCFSSKSNVGNEAEHWGWEHAWALLVTLNLFKLFGLVDWRPPSSAPDDRLFAYWSGDNIDGKGDSWWCIIRWPLEVDGDIALSLDSNSACKAWPFISFISDDWWNVSMWSFKAYILYNKWNESH